MNTYNIYGRIIGIKDSPERIVGTVSAPSHEAALRKAKQASKRTLTTVVTRVKLIPLQKFFYKGKRISAEQALSLAIKGKKVERK